MEWTDIEARLATWPCPTCHERLLGALCNVEDRGPALEIEARCRACGTGFLAAMERAGPPVTADDVLDLHDLLATWPHGMTALLAADAAAA